MEEHRVSVAGESFSNSDGSSRQVEIARCQIGELVTLEREPDNPHDPKCVKVVSVRGAQIGNIPRDSGWLADRIDAGDRIAAEIDYIGVSDSGTLGVVLAVEVSGQPRRRDEPFGGPLSTSSTQPPRDTKETLRGCLSLIAVCMLIYAVATCTSGGKDAPPPGEDVKAPKPVELLTADELAEAYDANEAAAQQRFDGKTLSVMGMMRRVDLDIDDDPVLYLEAEGTLAGVRVNLREGPDGKGAAASLVKGEQVNVTCESVREVLSDPILEECRILGANP